MGGDYPTGREFNFYTDTTGVQVINSLDDLGVKVVYLGYSVGKSVTYDCSAAPTDSPVYQAHGYYGHYTNSAWDPLTMLYAVRGLSYGGTTYFSYSPAGRNTVDGSGYNTFSTGPYNQYYLNLVMSPSAAATLLNSLISTTPLNAVGILWQLFEVPMLAIRMSQISLMLVNFRIP